MVCAGPTGVRTSVPRSSAWSRRRWSRTPSSCRSAPRAASSRKQLPDVRRTATRGWPRASPATRPSSRRCSTSPTTWSAARSCRRPTSSGTTSDDTYLVVAADKGTATFSDIANEVAADYNFWLGDAFASGGSAGYDHKGMGITARGAWESVKRHFRELGVDTQTEDFTVVGVGDMSGDVFGNGMLLLRAHPAGRGLRPPAHLHRPDPDAATSYAERAGSSSCRAPSLGGLRHGAAVGGRRHLSRVPPSRSRSRAQIRAALGIADDVAKMTPAELMKAILQAPVDLLWNGGIGTYVKASTETQRRRRRQGQRRDPRRRRGPAGQGRRRGRQPRPDPARPDRVRPHAGGRINTDAIDNSAGVDTSDHEVNIKILLTGLVADGDMTVKQRNKLLAEMTDEVGAPGAAQQLRAEHVALANAARPVPGPAPRPRSASCGTWCGRATWTGRWSSCPPTGRSASGSTPGRA